MSATAEHAETVRGFRHEAYLYSGEDEFVAGVARFVGDGVAAEEAVMVAVHPEKARAVADAVGPSSLVAYVDMPTLGRNPARIIPAWRDFLTEHPGTRVRGVGEPVWAGRSGEELTEAHLHEELLDVAFDDGDRDWWLLCPYDVDSLAPQVVEEARRTHREVLEAGSHHLRSAARPSDGAAALEAPLPPPQDGVDRVDFGPGDLSGLRRIVARRSEMAGLDGRRAELLVLAVNELTTNSLRHGGGAGELLMWRDDGSLVAEVRDRGRLEDPLVGRTTPNSEQHGGRGVWLVHQLCDLVQVRSVGGRTAIRVHMSLSA